MHSNKVIISDPVTFVDDRFQSIEMIMWKPVNRGIITNLLTNPIAEN